MALYRKHKGEYIELTTEQIKKLRRVDPVSRLQLKAEHAAYALIIHANWLRGIQRRSLKLDSSDLIVTRLPNVEKMEVQANELLTLVGEVRKS